MVLLQNNEMKKFAKKFAGIRKLVSNKTAKTQMKRDAQYQVEKEKMDKEVRGIENKVFKPRLKTTHGETEAPTYEVEFRSDYRNIMEAWEAGEKKLIQMTEAHMKNKPNIRLALGCRFQAHKSRINADNDDPETVEEVEVPGTTKQVNFKIRNVQLYNIESVKPTIKNMKMAWRADSTKP